MKTLTTMLYAIPLFVIFSCGATYPDHYPTTRWTKVADKIANYKVDRDEVAVGPRAGRFDKVKITVQNAPLNFHKCIIHFGNGDTQQLRLRKSFAKGSTSAVHDLNGKDRTIKKVVFWYDTKNKSRRRAHVHLWAR